MGIVTYQVQVESSISHTRMFKMLVLESGTYLPQVKPKAVKSFLIIEGDGGPGSVVQINFSEDMPLTHVKDIVDKIDTENLVFAYTMIGGSDPAVINDKIEKMSFEIKFEPTPNGGTIATRSCKAFTVDGVEVNEKEVIAAIDKNMQIFLQIFNSFSDWAIANSDA